MSIQHFGKRTLCAVLLCLLFHSCKDDSFLTELPASADASFRESFDNYQEAYDKGWRSINTSFPIGRKWYDVAESPNMGSPNYVAIYYPGWEQAQFTLDSTQFKNATFPRRYWKDAFFSQRASNGYVATSIACAEVIGFDFFVPEYHVSTWLVSPELLIKNGDKIIFYAYCRGLGRLQLHLNPTGNMNVGADYNATGDFSIRLLDINPGYDTQSSNPAKAFPAEWTRFEAEVTGLPGMVKGRFAFRYFLQSQPPIEPSPTDPGNFDVLFNQVHQSVIGIDEVTFESKK
ncbi:MAG TPA: choice-of-anchor J domain-containing protein [Ferruginibacter sp.]|nr:choice-of-anchor J domain-containing protein [Ferruginibacter sp.]HMP20250.1 choice-of-anchor J domain-containing protein [Ferruginibacter sp.]